MSDEGRSVARLNAKCPLRKAGLDAKKHVKEKMKSGWLIEQREKGGK